MGAYGRQKVFEPRATLSGLSGRCRNCCMCAHTLTLASNQYTCKNFLSTTFQLYCNSLRSKSGRPRSWTHAQLILWWNTNCGLAFVIFFLVFVKEFNNIILLLIKSSIGSLQVPFCNVLACGCRFFWMGPWWK